jgi:hypothetical protein
MYLKIITHIPMVFFISLLFLFMAPLNTVAAESGGPMWDDLTNQEKEFLKSIEYRWDDLPAERRVKLQKGAAQWLSMNPEQKKRVMKSLKQWNTSSSEKQQSDRKRLNDYYNLSPEQQESLRQTRQFFKNLPDGKDKNGRNRLQTTTPQGQKAFMNGFKAGTEFKKRRDGGSSQQNSPGQY